MRGTAFFVLGAAMLFGSVRGDDAPLNLGDEDFDGECFTGGEEHEHYGVRDSDVSASLTGPATCLTWCTSVLAESSTSPLHAIYWGMGFKCLCYVDSGSLIHRGFDEWRYNVDGPAGATGSPEHGESGPGGCYLYTAPEPPCAINVVVGIDQTSMKTGDTSTEAFKEKLFELTDVLPLGGADGVRMQVAFLQGHKQNGNKHKKQITTAMSVADSMTEGVNPRDFVTETGVIRRPRTPFLSFLGVDVPLFGEAVGHDRPVYCLVFTNKGDLSGAKEKKEFRKFAKAFKRDPPCTPVCYQNSPQTGGPSFLARVLCSDELSFYSDTYDAPALMETMCAAPP